MDWKKAKSAGETPALFALKRFSNTRPNYLF